jgi:hypothetical protein
MNSKPCKYLAIASRTTVTVLLGLVLVVAAATTASAIDCQAYSRITLNQVRVAIGKTNGGLGDGCAGATGDRWSKDTAAHFQWCQDATPEEAAAELKARRDLLLKCTAKRGKRKWPMWDAESPTTFTIVFWPPDAYGKGKCEGEGQIILKAVEAVQGDPSMLFDDAKDKYFYNSNYYHHFQHWKGIRCVLKNATEHTKAYFLEGYTGAGVATAPSDVPIAPGPIEGTELEKGPLEGTELDKGPLEGTELEKGPIAAPGPIEGTELEKGPIAAPPPAQPEQPYETKRGGGPLIQD